MGAFAESAATKKGAATSARLATKAVLAAAVLTTASLATLALPAAAAPPKPVMDAATSVTNVAATLEGTVNPSGTSTALSFCYSTSVITISGSSCTVTSGTISHATPAASPSSAPAAITVSAPVTGLTAATTYHVALGATQGASTTWSTPATFTTMTAGPFTCLPELYQENSNFLWRFDGASSAFVKVNAAAQATSLNGIGYDSVDNYIYGIGGTALYKVGADGNEQSLGTPANASSTGGDFLPGTNFLVTENGTGSFFMEDVASTSSATSPAPNSVKLGTTAGSATYGGYDIGMQLTGSNYVGYGLAMSGTGTATLYKAVIPTSVITANADSTAWSSLAASTIANAVTVTQVTAMTFSGGTAPGSADTFGATYRDTAGDALFYANTAKEIYMATAAQLATGTKFALSFSTNATILASGANDGAGCPSASSAFAAPVPVNDAYSDPAATTLTESAAVGTPLFANDQILPGATVTMGSVVLEPGAGQVTSTFSAGHTSGSLVGANGTLNVTDSTKGYFTFVPKAGFTGTETFTYNLVETAPFAGTSSTSATVTITVAKLAQAVAFTSTAPSSPPVGTTYTAAATGGASGNAVVLSIDGASTSGCTINAATGLVTFSGPPGTCIVDANQAGNATYLAAPQVQQTITVVKASQTITYTTVAPASPVVGGTYAAAATGGASGNAVTFSIDASSTSGCTVNAASGLVTFTGPAGTCVLDANQAGNASYLAAAQVQQSMTVAKSPQVITFTSSAPGSAKVGNTYSATATGGASGNAVTFSIDASSTSGCTVNAASGLVTFTGPAGTCVLDANQAGNAGYLAAAQAQQTIAVGKAAQTITFTSTAPVSPTVGSTYSAAATGGASGNAVTFSIDASSTSGCTVNAASGQVTFSSPAGTCVIDANQAGNASYLAAAQAQQSMTVAKAPQVITFTSSAPGAAKVGGTYTATATGGASGNAVTFSIDASSTSGCTVNAASGLVTFTGPAGTCVVDANQAGNAGYLAAAQAQQSIGVGKAAQAVSFTSTAPASPVVGGTYTATATGGASGNPVTFSIDATSTSGCTVNAASGFVSFAGPAGSCIVDADQAGNASYNAAPEVQQSMTVAKAAQVVTFTSSAPGSAKVNDTYTATATGGASGNPVTFSIDAASTSGCTVNPSTGFVTFTGPAGTCVVDANQAGNASYLAAAQVQQSVAVGKAAQAITFTSTAPTSPSVNDTYDATATGGASGNAVTFSIDATSTSGCTVNASSGHVTFAGPAGTCVVDADQAGNASYLAAAQAQQSIGVGKAAQAIDFTSTAPTSPAVNDTYTATATGGGSGNPVTFSIDASSTSGCTINAVTGHATFTGPAGTCVIDADQAGNASYLSAPEVDQSILVGLDAQAITFTSTAPTTPAVDDTYTATATGGASGNPVTFSIDATATSGCTINASTGFATFTGPAGTCVIDADQAGNASFAAAPEAQQTVNVGQADQTVTFTSVAPTAVVGDTYTATATGGGSGNPVTFSIDATSTSGCTINASTGFATFTGPAGSCVIDADQAGNASYNAAPEVQQTVVVAKVAQAITFTTSPPASPTVGATYSVSATGGASGNAVTFSIDATSTSGCTVDGTGLVTFSTPAGSCVIDADQAGTASYLAAPEATQSMTVAKAAQAIAFTSSAPASPVVGDTYTATATGGASGNPVTFSIDATSTSGCTVNAATGLVTFTGPAGTCVVDADEAGDAGYLAAPEQHQSITEAKAPQTVAFTSTAPGAPSVGGTYTATATGGASGNPVTFAIDASSTSGCTVNASSGHVDFTGPAGTCVVDADQAGNASFLAAPEVTQSMTVAKAAQAISFTSNAPSSPAVGSTYTATATGGASGNPVTFSVDATSTSGCTVDASTGLVTFTAPSGTCVIDADQAGSATYGAAPEVQQSVVVVKATQTITFTSIAPTSPAVGSHYTATATGGASGNPVTFSIDATSTSGCTVNASTGVVTFSAPEGTCVVDADQAGNASYSAAPEVTQSIDVGKAHQSIRFTSPRPASERVAASYVAAAVATSGLAVTLTIDHAAAKVCTIAARRVTFRATGVCVVDANQPGNASFLAAAQVQLRIRVLPSAHLNLTVHFANNSVTIDATARRQLSAFASQVRAHGLRHVSITGYASSTGTVAGNKRLGAKRAVAAEAYLKTVFKHLHVGGIHYAVAGKGASAFAVKNPASGLNRRDVLTAS